MTPPTCPNCQAPLPKMPQRKTKCKACGEFMFVKSTPDDRTKRLMTANQAEAADLLWRAHQDHAHVVRHTESLGLDPADFTHAAGSPIELRSAIHRALEQRAASGDPLALIGRAMNSTTVAEAVAAQRLRMQRELDQARRVGKTVQIFGVDPACPICGPLNRQVFPADTPAAFFVPADCPRIARVTATPMMCSICVSAWIKRPDGTSYIDRQPTARGPQQPPVKPTRTPQLPPPAPPAASTPPEPTLAALRPLPSPPQPSPPPRPWWKRIFGG